MSNTTHGSHRWAPLQDGPATYAIIDAHVLERGRHGELDALEHVGQWPAQVAACKVCGTMVAWVNVYRRNEPPVNFCAYGLDLDSLAVMHRAPSCEVLTMPSRPLDEDDDDNAATPEAA